MSEGIEMGYKFVCDLCDKYDDGDNSFFRFHSSMDTYEKRSDPLNEYSKDELKKRVRFATNLDACGKCAGIVHEGLIKIFNKEAYDKKSLEGKA